MAKRDMKSALTHTLNAENAAVRDRFDKAESLIRDTPHPAETSTKEVSLPLEAEVTASTVSKQKVIRDTFSLPVDDYELIALIQQRCLRSALNVTKGEIIRAGLKVLHALPDEKLVQALENVEKLKPGKRKKK